MDKSLFLAKVKNPKSGDQTGYDGPMCNQDVNCARHKELQEFLIRNKFKIFVHFYLRGFRACKMITIKIELMAVHMALVIMATIL